MRFALVVLLLVAVSGSAYAFESSHFSADGPVNLPEVRDVIYCQTIHSGWNAYNASSAFDAEMADDIPGELAGQDITVVTLYMAQWGGGHQDATSVTVNFYYSACPPSVDPDLTYVVPWAAITVTNIYAGSWYVDQLDIPLPEAVTISDPMSLGAVVNIDWGQNAPYTGLCVTDDYDVVGCELYWDGEYWGVPRWTPGSQYFGVPRDLAYCLAGGPTATEPTTWGSVKSLYR